MRSIFSRGIPAVYFSINGRTAKFCVPRTRIASSTFLLTRVRFRWLELLAERAQSALTFPRQRLSAVAVTSHSMASRSKDTALLPMTCSLFYLGSLDGERNSTLLSWIHPLFHECAAGWCFGRKGIMGGLSNWRLLVRLREPLVLLSTNCSKLDEFQLRALGVSTLPSP